MSQALGAFKSVGMLAFMMWMSGSQLHIFSIMSTMSGLFQPISAILSSGKGVDVPYLKRRPEIDRFCPAAMTLGLQTMRSNPSWRKPRFLRVPLGIGFPRYLGLGAGLQIA